MSPRIYRLIAGKGVGRELADAVQWYEDRDAGLGTEFLRVFRAATAALRRNPLLYQIVMGNARRVPLRRFPYSILYEVHSDDVVILACFHESRDPDEWQRRITRL